MYQTLRVSRHGVRELLILVEASAHPFGVQRIFALAQRLRIHCCRHGRGQRRLRRQQHGALVVLAHHVCAERAWTGGSWLYPRLAPQGLVEKRGSAGWGIKWDVQLDTLAKIALRAQQRGEDLEICGTQSVKFYEFLPGSTYKTERSPTVLFVLARFLCRRVLYFWEGLAPNIAGLKYLL